MRKALVALMIVLTSVGVPSQRINTGNRRKAVVGCTPPSMLHRWTVGTVTCSGGSPCTNGAGIDTITDTGTGSASNAEQPTSGNRPIYNTAVVGGNPVATFTAASSQSFTFHNNISDSLMTVYVVIKPTSGTWFGGGSGTGGGVQYFYNGANQQFNSLNRTIIGTGTSSLSTASFQTIVLTYDFSSGAWSMYKCSGGSCAGDGSGTQTASFGFPINQLGGSAAAGFFSGQIAELAYNNSISTTGIATYSQCQYGI